MLFLLYISRFCVILFENFFFSFHMDRTTRPLSSTFAKVFLTMGQVHDDVVCRRLWRNVRLQNFAGRTAGSGRELARILAILDQTHTDVALQRARIERQACYIITTQSLIEAYLRFEKTYLHLHHI